LFSLPKLGSPNNFFDVETERRKPIIEVPQVFISSLDARLRGFTRFDFIKKLASFQFVLDSLDAHQKLAQETNFELDESKVLMVKNLPCFPGELKKLNFRYLSFWRPRGS